MAADVVSVDVPMTFRKRCGRKVIVLSDGTQGNTAPRATIDNTMVKAIARAFRWQALLENRTYGCLEEIGKAEKIAPSFVSRVIRLALLAPDIVEAILAGRQPAHLTLRDLMGPFPVDGTQVSGSSNKRFRSWLRRTQTCHYRVHQFGSLFNNRTGA